MTTAIDFDRCLSMEVQKKNAGEELRMALQATAMEHHAESEAYQFR